MRKGEHNFEKHASEIVLTGGPCAGKTTALCYIQEKLMDKGFRVFLVPEVATMVIAGGVHDIERLSGEELEIYLSVQREMLRIQMDLRARFNNLASAFPNEKKVIIYDRGPMDIGAYIGNEYLNAILEEERLNLVDARDSFDGVVHLVTAAIGAEAFYSKANNSARREGATEAKISDDKTLHAWVGHPHLKIIDNSTGFDLKLKRVLRAISGMLGIPVPLEIERKFLVRGMPDLNHPFLARAQEIFIEQAYLAREEDGVEERIRKRTQSDSSIYYRTRKLNVSPGVRQETERMIRPVEYVRLISKKDPDTSVIKKRRICFVYKSQYFELDMFIDPAGPCVLEIELTEEHDKVDLPPFIEIEKEVTNDSRYSNYWMARKRGFK